MDKDKENVIQVYLEIEQFSNIKYEYNKETKKLEVDRLLERPYVYPYAYGFIPDTCADDGDELDILIITNEPLKNDMFYDVFIIGALNMEDEKGIDEKVLCVLVKDYEKIKDMDDISNDSKLNIFEFFSNYKKNIPNKWSNVTNFVNKQEAIYLYNKYKINNEDKTFVSSTDVF